jgi:hypothetical protein
MAHKMSKYLGTIEGLKILKGAFGIWLGNKTSR